MSDPEINQAIQILREEGVIAYPTEAVYGLGCDPNCPAAIERILAIKQRPAEKGLILVAADITQLAPYLAVQPEAVWRRVKAEWPGPVTWVMAAKPEVSALLRGQHTGIAVRVSAHPLVRALCLAFGGAIVSTSANPSGHEPARSAAAVKKLFGDTVDFILPGAVGGAAGPSMIRDAASGEIIRAANGG